MEQYIAVDIGGTGIKYGITDSDGKLLSLKSVSTPTMMTSDQVLWFLADLVRSMQCGKAAGIGISTLGVVDQQAGKVVGACDNFPGLYQAELKRFLERQFAVPVSVMNDVNAAAMGEAYFGSGKELAGFYCITLGTGIGGALVMNRRVVGGANGMAGEVGYLWKGPDTGGYEEIASVKAFLESTESVNAGLDGIAVFERVFNEDPAYTAYFSKWVNAVAAGIRDIVYILDPGTVIIGGGISQRGSALTKPIEAALNRLVADEFKNKTRVIAAAHSNMSNLFGAITPLLDSSE